MKTKITTIALLLASLAAPALHAQETETRTFKCIADTWLREGNTSFTGGAKADKLEVRMDGNSTDGYSNFFGLLGFNFEIPEGKKVKSAILYLITERKKGGNVLLRPYLHDFNENNVWVDESEHFYNALELNPLVEFTPLSEGSKALASGDVISEDYLDISKWTNAIDVTSYLITLPNSTSRINFLLTSASPTNTNQNCFFSKENTGVTRDGWQVSSEELVPYLEVAFEDIPDDITIPTTYSPYGDILIREGNNHQDGSAVDIEIKVAVDNDGNVSSQFHGLMGFELPLELLTGDYVVKSANLKLVTTQLKGSANMYIYDFKQSFDENSVDFAQVADNVKKIYSADPITQFEAKGQWGAKLGSTGPSDYLDSKNATVEAWINNIDLKDFINKKIKAGVSSLVDSKFLINLMLAKKDDGEATRIATKEAKDITVKVKDGDDIPFKGDDLKPVLTLDVIPRTEVEINDIVVTLDDETISSEQHVELTEPALFKIKAKNATSINVNWGGDKNESNPGETKEWYSNDALEEFVFSNTRIIITASNEYDSKDFTFYLTIEQEKEPEVPALDSNREAGHLKLIVNKNHDLYYNFYILPKEDAGYEENTVRKVTAQQVEGEAHDGYFKSVDGNGHVEITDNPDGTETHNFDGTSLAKKFNYDSLEDIPDGKVLLLSAFTCKPSTDATEPDQHSPVIVYAVTQEGVTTDIESILSEVSGAVEYFDLQGRRVVNPEKGVYIMRQGSKVIKVVK